MLASRGLAVSRWLAFSCCFKEARAPQSRSRSASAWRSTGGLAPNGKSALLAMQIWEKDINAKGGLLGRPVKLIYYDDQSQPSTVPAIYTQAPRRRQGRSRGRALCHGADRAGDADRDAAQPRLHHPPGPRGQRPVPLPPLSSRSRPMARARRPSPRASSNSRRRKIPSPRPSPSSTPISEYAHANADGARDNAKEAGLKVVYDKSYPPTTTDFSPIVRAIQATNPDVLFDRLLSARFGRHGPRHPRGRHDAQDWSAAAWSACKRRPSRRSSGRSSTASSITISGCPARRCNIDGVMDVLKRYQAEAAEGRRRSARLLHGAVVLRLSPGAGRRGRGDQGPRPGQDRANTCTRRPSRRSSATSSSARTANGPSRACSGAVPAHHQQRRGAVPRPQEHGDPRRRSLKDGDSSIPMPTR